MSTVTFNLSPADRETIHRVLGVAVPAEGSTLDTGGSFMNDLYPLPDGRVLCVYEYGALIYSSMDIYNTDPSSESDNDNTPHIHWGDEHHWLDHDSLTLDMLIDLWADNCEMLFCELGSADEMLIKHGATISPVDRAWVELFIEVWDQVQEDEGEEFDAQCRNRGE